MIQSDLSGHGDRLPLVLLRVTKLRGAGTWNKSREGLIRVIATHIQENVAFIRLVKAVHSTPYRDSFVVVFLFVVRFMVYVFYTELWRMSSANFTMTL